MPSTLRFTYMIGAVRIGFRLVWSRIGLVEVAEAEMDRPAEEVVERDILMVEAEEVVGRDILRASKKGKHMSKALKNI